MTTTEIAHIIAQGINAGIGSLDMQAIYHENAVHIEPDHTMIKSQNSLADIIAGSQKMSQSFKELHKMRAGEPTVVGNFFSLAQGLDATFVDGNRVEMNEIGIYEVKDGKVIKATFYY